MEVILGAIHPGGSEGDGRPHVPVWLGARAATRVDVVAERQLVSFSGHGKRDQGRQGV